MIQGYEEFHEEQISVGPDGKPVRKSYSVRRELDGKEAERLLHEHSARMDSVFQEMERAFPAFDGFFGKMAGIFRPAGKAPGKTGRA